MKTLYRFLIVLTLLSSAACASNQPVSSYFLSAENDQQGKVTILSSHLLNFPKQGEQVFAGISDLAWDDHSEVLYAISDKGDLFHLKLEYNDKAIVNARIIASYPLLNSEGEPLKSKYRDAEGLTLSYQNNQPILNVSFERVPRVIQYDVQGKWLKALPLPESIKSIENYRHPNKALEGLINHPQYGLLTAAEYPLKDSAMSLHSIYSLQGKQWPFLANRDKNSAITALEVLPNNNLLILERAWSGPLRPLVITLQEVDLQNCVSLQKCSSEILARLSTADQWRLDNFEGLTKFKNGQYLMISDDNASPTQDTILVLFTLQKTH